ncbi:MAG TPA: hypothetical protein VFW08_09880 [bacterium]|nr:hypothetical protein [bacterium]
MGRIREFIKKNPIAGWAAVLVLVAAAGYVVSSQFFGSSEPAASPPTAPASATPPRTPAATPAPGATPAPAATPAPGQAPSAQAVPAPAPAVVVPKATVPPGPVGRDDPFLPVVRDTGPPAGTPPPPGAPLPPPPFPTPGQQLPPPPLPGGGVPPLQAGQGGVAVTGIVGNSHAVAIIVVGGRTEIVGAGDELGDLRVVRVDPNRRLVTFLRAGTRFDVRMGGE